LTQDQCYLLGYIVKSHGTKGQVMFHLDVDYPEEYDGMDSVFVEIKGELVPYFVDSINIQKQGRAIVQLEEVDTMEKAQALVGTALYMPLDTLEELDEDQFYYHEIKGFEVVDQTMGALGMVRDVYLVATQNLIALDYRGVEVLIPVVDDIVLTVNREKKQLMVSLPEGLLEVYTDAIINEEADDRDDDEN
jgi:16S rRNA processing protein RimM